MSNGADPHCISWSEPVHTYTLWPPSGEPRLLTSPSPGGEIFTSIDIVWHQQKRKKKHFLQRAAPVGVWNILFAFAWECTTKNATHLGEVPRNVYHVRPSEACSSQAVSKDNRSPSGYTASQFISFMTIRNSVLLKCYNRCHWFLYGTSGHCKVLRWSKYQLHIEFSRKKKVILIMSNIKLVLLSLSAAFVPETHSGPWPQR